MRKQTALHGIVVQPLDFSVVFWYIIAVNNGRAGYVLKTTRRDTVILVLCFCAEACVTENGIQNIGFIGFFIGIPMSKPDT